MIGSHLGHWGSRGHVAYSNPIVLGVELALVGAHVHVAHLDLIREEGRLRHVSPSNPTNRLAELQQEFGCLVRGRGPPHSHMVGVLSTHSSPCSWAFLIYRGGHSVYYVNLVWLLWFFKILGLKKIRTAIHVEKNKNQTILTEIFWFSYLFSLHTSTKWCCREEKQNSNEFGGDHA
jgi:hypothetical protein